MGRRTEVGFDIVVVVGFVVVALQGCGVSMQEHIVETTLLPEALHRDQADDLESTDVVLDFFVVVAARLSLAAVQGTGKYCEQ